MKMKTMILAALVFSSIAGLSVQAGDHEELSDKGSTQRVVLITLDGYRWQELFGGADSLLISNTKYVPDTASLRSAFWRPSAQQRRVALMPFVWTDVVSHGTLLGDRYAGGRMQVANGMHFSYPGYSEDLCGYPDDAHVNSNEKKENPNVSILEVANALPAWHDSVLAFGSWDVFPYILNEHRSHLEVNAGYRHSLSPQPTPYEKVLDQIEDESPRHWEGVRFDVYTFHYALEAMKTRHPKLIYIAFGETDDFAHEGRYDQYLKSARRTDDFIRRLWEYTQQDAFYRGKTTFIITCDHGRGDTSGRIASWCSHGASVPHSEQTWLIAFGKGIPSRGVVKDRRIYYNKQVAPTIARLLGIGFHPDHPDAGTPIDF